MIVQKIADAARTKTGKGIIFGLGTIVLTLTAIHYWHQIKLARLNLKEKEKALAKG